MLQQRINEMFSRMVEATDVGLVLTTNGRVQDLAAFRAGHGRVHPTGIGYRVEYDEDCPVGSGDRLAGRGRTTTDRPAAFDASPGDR